MQRHKMESLIIWITDHNLIPGVNGVKVYFKRHILSSLPHLGRHFISHTCSLNGNDAVLNLFLSCAQVFCRELNIQQETITNHSLPCNPPCF